MLEESRFVATQQSANQKRALLCCFIMLFTHEREYR